LALGHGIALDLSPAPSPSLCEIFCFAFLCLLRLFLDSLRLCVFVPGGTTGYVQNTNAAIGQRLITEARASLPGFIETPSTETIFEGLELQRIRLHHDQQIPEW
jgi:hypothetical protein